MGAGRARPFRSGDASIGQQRRATEVDEARVERPGKCLGKLGTCGDRPCASLGQPVGAPLRIAGDRREQGRAIARTVQELQHHARKRIERNALVAQIGHQAVTFCLQSRNRARPRASPTA